MSFDPQLAGETVSGTLTAASIIWGLQGYLIWRAIGREGRAPILGYILLLLTILGFLSVTAGVLSLHLLTNKTYTWQFSFMYSTALVLTLLVSLLVTCIYILVVADFIRR